MQEMAPPQELEEALLPFSASLTLLVNVALEELLTVLLCSSV